MSTDAVPNISGEIKHHFRDHCWAAHVPRGAQELELRVRTEVGDRTEREPSLEQLADTLSASLERIRDARAASEARISESLDRPLDIGILGRSMDRMREHLAAGDPVA